MRQAVKTCYIYSMGSRLVNVRLDADRLRKAQRLREQGVTLSDVVREAIDERFRALGDEVRPDVQTLVKSLLERYPDPPGLAPRDYDVHHRQAARAAIRRRLRPRR